jgi:NagD protein
VLVARDIEFSYAKLERASRYVQAGARLVATNTDASHPGEYGYRVPETGALVASIQTVAGEHVRVLGKPEVYLFRKALERLGVPAHRAVMVGDNPRTDVAGARRAGICSVWLNPLGMKVTDNCTPWMECGSLDELLRELRDSQNREDA